jgi:hypothetical protein
MLPPLPLPPPPPPLMRVLLLLLLGAAARCGLLPSPVAVANVLAVAIVLTVSDSKSRGKLRLRSFIPPYWAFSERTRRKFEKHAHFASFLSKKVVHHSVLMKISHRLKSSNSSSPAPASEALVDRG